MAKRIVTKIGNVFCVEIDSEKKAYFQYVANDMSMLNSSVIRAFKTHYPINANPKIDVIVNDEIAFYAHTILKFGIVDNAWYKVDTSKEIGASAIEKVIFGTTQDTIFEPSLGVRIVNPLENWTLWKINGTRVSVGVLPREYWNIVEPGVIFPCSSIIERIKYSYYRNTSIDYDVLKRKPLSNVDSFIKVVGERLTTYYQFKGQRAIKELIITDKGVIKLTDDSPNAKGYELRKADFSETNWLHKNFITRQEFEEAWNLKNDINAVVSNA